MRMDVTILFALVLFPILAISGCGSVVVNVDLRDCPNPVICSPIMRIGDTAPPENELVPFDEFTAESSYSYSGHHWEYHGTQYGTTHITHVYEKNTSQFYERSDDVAIVIQKATAGRSDLVVVVDEIENVCYQHNSIFGFVFDYISLKGKTVLPDHLKR